MLLYTNKEKGRDQFTSVDEYLNIDMRQAGIPNLCSKLKSTFAWPTGLDIRQMLYGKVRFIKYIFHSLSSSYQFVAFNLK